MARRPRAPARAQRAASSLYPSNQGGDRGSGAVEDAGITVLPYHPGNEQGSGTRALFALAWECSVGHSATIWEQRPHCPTAGMRSAATRGSRARPVMRTGTLGAGGGSSLAPDRIAGIWEGAVIGIEPDDLLSSSAPDWPTTRRSAHAATPNTSRLVSRNRK
jgi:hypothetical protein